MTMRWTGFVLLLSLAFSACRKQVPVDDDLYGEWTLTSVKTWEESGKFNDDIATERFDEFLNDSLGFNSIVFFSRDSLLRYNYVLQSPFGIGEYRITECEEIHPKKPELWTVSCIETIMNINFPVAVNSRFTIPGYHSYCKVRKLTKNHLIFEISAGNDNMTQSGESRYQHTRFTFAKTGKFDQ